VLPVHLLPTQHHPLLATRQPQAAGKENAASQWTTERGASCGGYGEKFVYAPAL